MPARSRIVIAILAAAGLITGLVAARPGLAAAGTRPQPAAARLAIGARLRHQLLRLYAAQRRIPVTDIAGTVPGQTLGASTPGGRKWAMIHFTVTRGAPMRVRIAFQDGAGTGIFTRVPGGAWTVAGLAGVPMGCGLSLPASVRQAWHLASCQVPRKPVRRAGQAAPAGTTGGLVNIARAQVGVADDPVSASFSDDCNPYTTLVGQSGLGTCSATESHGSWFHNVTTHNEKWCADFTKWVWEKAGVTSDLGTLTPSAASFYTWGVQHGEHISFGGTPKAGDAVLFYPPGTATPDGSYADHVGIVTVVNSNGSVNLVNGDFLGSSNISVQYNTNIPGPSWYAQGEEWAFVSPELSSGSGPGGGVSAASPAVYDQASGHLEVYGTGTDGALEESYYTGSGWTEWAPVDPAADVKVTGVPDAVFDPVTNNLEVYAVGTSHTLQEFYWSAGAWHYNGSLKGSITASPSAIYDPVTKNLEVYARGTGGDLQEQYYNGTSWAMKWNIISDPGTIANSPCAVVDPLDNTVEVYAAGTNHILQEFYWSAGAWHYNGTLTASINSSPSAVYDPGTKHMEVYMTAVSGQLAEEYWSPGGEWVQAGLRGSLTDSPSAVYNPIDGNLEVYARGLGGTLKEKYYHGSAWSKWITTKVPVAGSPHAIYDTSTSNLEVYWLTTGHAVSERYWNTSGWHNASLHGTLSAL